MMKKANKIKVVAFNGSPRKNGNTSILIKHAVDELKKAGIETEVIQIGGKKVHGCTACGKCFEKKDMKCIIKDDFVNECIEKIMAADGVLLASPTYFADVTTEMKALIDRAGFVAKANDDAFKLKAGASIVAVRRGGAIHAFDTMNHFFFISQMIVPGSSYWNVGIGMDKGDVMEDAEGIQTMKTLGKNMAWLLKKIKT